MGRTISEAAYTRLIEAAAPEDCHREVEKHFRCNRTDFINTYASINVVRKYRHLDKTPYASGNSRDNPTKFVFVCPNSKFGCKRTYTTGSAFRKHTLICPTSEEGHKDAEARLRYPCGEPGCNRVFRTETYRTAHRDQVHLWEDKECHKGKCTGETFTSHKTWQTHQRRYHQAGALFTPMSCPIPGCQSSGEFRSEGGLLVHIKQKHTDYATPNDYNKFLPHKQQSKYFDWVTSSCPFLDAGKCKDTREWDTKEKFRNHLRYRHEITDSSALEHYLGVCVGLYKN